MAIVAIKGTGIRLYFKEGYNIVRRYQRGDAPDEDMDLFEYLGSSRLLKDAEKKAERLEGVIEIIKHKHTEEDL